MKDMHPFPLVTVLRHPLLEHNLAILRNCETDNRLFRETLAILSQLLVYEVTGDLPLAEITVQTPMESTTCAKVSCPILLVPVLRAGLGMSDSIQRLLPTARMGHIGIYRDEETCEPIEYYCKLPNGAEKMRAFLLDPMLATGGSLSYAATLLKERGVQNITIVSILAAPEGIHAVREKHPDIPIFTAALDRQLNDRGYILPGLGDCGDRIFGTV